MLVVMCKFYVQGKGNANLLFRILFDMYLLVLRWPEVRRCPVSYVTEE